MASRASLVIAVLCLIWVASAPATDLNKDFGNYGNYPAYGVKFVFAAPETFTGYFSGYSWGSHCYGYFRSFAPPPHTPSSTYIEWTDYDNDGDNTIDPNDCVHVGWTTADRDFRIRYAQWLDASGNPMPWSYVVDVGGRFIYQNGTVSLVISNDSDLGQEGEGETPDVLVRDVAAEAFPSRWALSSLNANNDVLNGALLGQPDGGWISSGSETAIPLQLGSDPVPPDYYVVARFRVEAWYHGQTYSVSTDWIQDSVTSAPPPPPYGACCYQNGSCAYVSAEVCQASGGQYIGDGVPCDPNPCQPTPTKTTTWGHIKTSYR